MYWDLGRHIFRDDMDAPGKKVEGMRDEVNPPGDMGKEGS